MRIMIPTSGGVDSTVLLRDSLTHTNHTIIAVHYEEDYSEWFKTIKEIQRESFNRVIAHLKKRHRPFEVYIRPTVNAGVDGLLFDKEESHPARAGFKDKRNFHFLRCRAATHATAALALQADEVRIPLTSLDWRYGSSWWHKYLEEFHNKIDIPLTLPWGEPPPSMHVVSEKGRMQAMRELGQDLQKLVLSCYTPDRGERCTCVGCLQWKFYKEFCEGRSLEEVRDIDDELSRRAQYGKYYNDADPKTYNSDSIWDVLIDHDAWRVGD